MKLFPSLVSVGALALLVLLVCAFESQSGQPAEIALIVTAAPEYQPLAALRGGERFPHGAQFMLVRNGQATQLIEGFAATADANVSFDGSKLLFAAKPKTGDPWSIWEFTFEDRSVRKVIGGSTDVVRPLYLPFDRVVYSRHTAQGFQLQAANLDGSDVLNLAYMSASALPETVLADGRILFSSGFPLGTDLDHGAVPELFLVYSDGSGVESYRCDHGSPRWGGVQLASGDVVFTHGTRLARFTSPLANEATIAAPLGEYAGAPLETATGQWLVSARSSGQSHYALKRWNLHSAVLENVMARKDEDLVEAVQVAPRPRPIRHPSALHKWDYANLLALDARQSRDGAIKGTPVTVRLEAQDENGNATTMGEAPVEPDGSFFVKVPGDRPIRFILLDGKGAELRKERGWFWIRNGEQRYCVGCHAGPERAPENNVPSVLLRTTTPADLTRVGQSAVPGGQ